MALNLLLTPSDLPEDQKNSRQILYTHVAHKGAQVGSIFGAVVGGLAFAFGRRSSPNLLGSMSRFANYGAAISPVGFSALCMSKMQGKEEIEWQDRSWRLQRNDNQNLMDGLTDVALLLGLVQLAPAGLAIASSVVGGVCYLQLKQKVAVAKS